MKAGAPLARVTIRGTLPTRPAAAVGVDWIAAPPPLALVTSGDDGTCAATGVEAPTGAP